MFLDENFFEIEIQKLTTEGYANNTNSSIVVLVLTYPWVLCGIYLHAQTMEAKQDPFATLLTQNPVFERYVD